MHETLSDIKNNVIELSKRIKRTQDFVIPCVYLDKDNEKKESELTQYKFSEEWENIYIKGLWRLHEINGRNYIIKHQQSIRDFESSLELLMLEIGKFEILIYKLETEKVKVNDMMKRIEQLIERTKSKVSKIKEKSGKGNDFDVSEPEIENTPADP